ncbi:MAG: FAD binding domain-containing protein [Polyangiaceae bacterium]|jgi:4-hydroxybenzoyl-CoA reductase subunit beta|nr:FAD binding domain-containing protein [Polyangiaceae bacterium]MBK8942655.1 FAD binding domain-containing protein [Polyangiaceae bacterium]
MLPLPRFTLHRPATIAEAAALLHHLGRDGQLLAGGTDLLPNMKQGLVGARALVSLQRIDGLSGVDVAGSSLSIGAMTPLARVASDPRVREAAPALSEAAAAVGGPHHRRMGTLGGNLCLDTRCRYYNQTYFWRSALGFCLKKDGTVCHVVAGGQRCVAAASNDTAPALIALEAAVTLESVRGARVVPVGELYTADGITNTTREPDEIVTRVTIPLERARSSGFEKLRRRGAIDFPLLSVAARIDRDGDALRAVELVVSALAARPRRVAAAARLAPGARPTAELRAQLAQAAKKECRPLDNIEGDPAWRHEMVPVLVERLLARLGVG